MNLFPTNYKEIESVMKTVRVNEYFKTYCGDIYKVNYITKSRIGAKKLEPLGDYSIIFNKETGRPIHSYYNEENDYFKSTITREEYPEYYL